MISSAAPAKIRIPKIPNVHSRVRATAKYEAVRVSKRMLRLILPLERLTLLEAEGKVGYRRGEKGADLETMDYLKFIARVTSHIPDKEQVMVRRNGLCANAPGGEVRKGRLAPSPLRIVEEEPQPVSSEGWAAD